MTATQTTLLLVEDDAAIRHFLMAALEDAGFAVVCAAAGAGAIAELEREGAPFRALVTDIRLGPGPDGWDIARLAREHIHDLPVIYMSGDSAADWSSKGVPNSVIVAKPFVAAQIVTAVATLMTKTDTDRAH
jgi:DNA-binding response OmpR family regulator